MRRRTPLALGMVVLVSLSTACEETPGDVPVPDALDAVAGDGQQAEVATQVPEPLVVRVLDQNDDPLSGVSVQWGTDHGSITGDEATDGEGRASATWTLGTEAGAQTATASTSGDLSASFEATAVAGALASLTVSPETLTLEEVGETSALAAAGADAHGNPVAVAPTWTSRDTSVVDVDTEGTVEALGAGETWVVAEAGGAADSARVVVELEEPEPGIDPELVGAWVETSLTYESAADPAQVVVEDDGYVALLTLRADGSFEFQEVAAGESELDAGTWSVLADTLFLASLANDTTYRYPYTLEDDVITAEYVEEAGYDFDDDGTDEPTNTTSVWARRTELIGLAGTWTSQSVVAVNIDDSEQSVDLSSDIDVAVTFTADGSYVLVYNEPDAESEVEGGWSVTGGDGLWLVEEGGAVTRFGLGLDGDAATLTILDDAFDFEEDGTPEGALITIELARGATSGGEIDDDLVGEWLGISYILQNQDDPGQEVDVVVEESWLMELTLNGDGTWSHRETYSNGEVGWQDAGTWYVRQDSIVLYSGREQDSVAVAYSKPAPDRFSYTSENEEGWDFNGNGIDSPTHETALMARRIDDLLVGTWVAESQVIVDAADPGHSMDVLAAGGSMTLTFHADGGFLLEQQEPDLDDLWDLDGELLVFTGEYAAAGPFLWVKDSGGVDQIPFTYDGDSITIVSEYSLDTGNPADDVIETVVFVGQ